MLNKYNNIKSSVYKGLFAMFTLTTLVIAHWSLANFYVAMCAPTGFVGILQTALGMGSPICSFLISVQQRTSELYTCIWLSIIIAMWNFGNALREVTCKKS